MLVCVIYYWLIIRKIGGVGKCHVPIKTSRGKNGSGFDNYVKYHLQSEILFFTFFLICIRLDEIHQLIKKSRDKLC